MRTSDMHKAVLSLQDLDAGYGRIQILHNITFDVAAGEVVVLLGANGVGKTTLINTICGFLAPSGGRILFRGEDITGRPPHQTFKRGIVQVSQSRDLFPDLSVEDNLRLGATSRGSSRSVDAELERVFASFPRLSERRQQYARTLSGGEQQMVAIGRAVMGEPAILLLDEPSGGLAPKFVQEIGTIVHGLKEAGATMLLVEQNFGLAMRVADRILVLRDGRLVDDIEAGALTGTQEELVQRVYL